MKYCEEWRHVHYLDEMQESTDKTRTDRAAIHFSRPDNGAEKSNRSRLIVVHIGSGDGFVPGRLKKKTQVITTTR